MKNYLDITKALSDETRVRILMMLADDELCLCQIIEVMKLAPSTISKHLSILYNANLVKRRKLGRFQYYKLASKSAATEVRNILKYTLNALTDTPAIKSDRKQLTKVLALDTEQLCECYH